MIILRIVSRGLDRETYATMREMLDIDHKHPLGLMMHGVAEKDGKMQVAQVWAGPEYARQFDEELLAPVVQAVGAPTNAEITVFELEDVVTP